MQMTFRDRMGLAFVSSWIVWGGGVFPCQWDWKNQTAIAQIIPDSSLGAAQSTLTPGGVIGGGAVRGANLFHSFSTFNIPNGASVYFANPAGVERIFSRVTGTTRSTLLGTLGVLGSADLFFLNPNGILFGPNARLDVRGSFIASTANSLIFDNGFAFSATNPQAPSLLAVNVPLGLQYGSTPPGSLLSQGILAVNQGQSLVLAGGELTLNRSVVGVRSGRGGRVELGAVAGAGTIGLSQAGGQIRLSFPDTLARADVTIANGSVVETWAQNGGSITIHAQNVTLAGGSRLTAGIARGLGTVDSQAGDITLDAIDTIRADGSRTEILNTVYFNALGRAGNVILTARSLVLSGGVQVGTAVFGQGQGGNLIVNASDRVVVESLPSSGDTSSLFNTVAPRSIGNGGDTVITTDSLLINSGGRIISSSFGQGDAGRITIRADTVALDGSGAQRDFPSAVVSQVATPGIGNGGNIEITANTFSLTNGAQLAASSFGRGTAGTVRVTVQGAATISGESRNGNPSGIFSSLENTAIGRGGDIEIQAGSLLIANQGAGLFASTIGRGDSGQIRVLTAADIEVSRGGRVLATVEPGAVGNAQGITLQGRSLLVNSGGQISTNTFGQGNAGTIRIATTEAVMLAGEGSVLGSRSGGISSNARSAVRQDIIGSGGNIVITTNQFQVRDRAFIDAQTQTNASGGTITVNANTALVNSGGQFRTTTFGSGQSGNIVLNVVDYLALMGSDTGLFANTAIGSTGNGGNILIDPRSVMLGDRSRISVDSQGRGEGGNIQIQADRLTLDNQAAISAETVSNTGGNINLSIRDILLLRQGSTISTTAGTAQGNGDGGNIRLNAGFIVAVPTENSDITANAFSGRGGNIAIATQGIFGIAFRSAVTPLSDITASSEFGLAGNVSISTLGIDPVQSAIELPTNFSQPPLAQGCRATSRASSFKNTGQGGVPSNPVDPIVADAIWQDLAPIEAAGEQGSKGAGMTDEFQNRKSQIEPIVETQGWIVSPDGSVILIASAPSGSPDAVGSPAIHCMPE